MANGRYIGLDRAPPIDGYKKDANTYPKVATWVGSNSFSKVSGLFDDHIRILQHMNTKTVDATVVKFEDKK
jgi:hypothetical protein